MVSGFFGGGAAKGFRAERALDIEEGRAQTALQKVQQDAFQFQQTQLIGQLKDVDEELLRLQRGLDFAVQQGRREDVAVLKPIIEAKTGLKRRLSQSVGREFVDSSAALARTANIIPPAEAGAEAQAKVDVRTAPANVAAEARRAGEVERAQVEARNQALTGTERNLNRLNEEKIKAGKGPLTFEEISTFLKTSAQGFGFSTTVDPATGTISFRGGPGAGTASTAGGSAIPKASVPQAIDINTRLATGEEAITVLDTLAQLPDTAYGQSGAIRRPIREAVRIGKERARDVLPEALVAPLTRLGRLAETILPGDADADRFQKTFQRDPLTSLRGLQNRLTFMYARALQPTGKLLATTLERAAQDTDFTSFFSSAQTARERLKLIRDAIESRVAIDRRAVQSLSGSAPPAEATQPSPGTDESFPAQSGEAEGQTGTSPDGRRWIVRGGQWVPVQ